MASTVHMVSAEDDARHTPGPASLPLWNESFWFSFYDPRTQIGVTARVGMHPNKHEGNIYLLVAQGGGIVHSLIDLRAPVPDIEATRLEMHGYVIEWDRPLERFRLQYQMGLTGFDVVWEGVSPVYVYPFPPESTSDQVPRHIEHAGSVRGSVTIGGTRHDVDCLGHRDHSWGGERDWTKLPHWDYLSGEFGPDLWFNVVKVSVTGFPQDIYLGGLWDGKELLKIADVRLDVETGDGGTRQLAADLRFRDERGAEHHITSEEVLAIAPVWFGRTCVKDGFTRYRYGDRTGYGIMELGYIQK